MSADKTPETVDLPPCLVTLNRRRGASDRSASSCHRSNSLRPAVAASSTASAGTRRREAARALSVSMSRLSRSAVTTLQLLDPAGQLLEVRPLPYFGGPQKGVVALECHGAPALIHAPIEHAGDYVAHIPLDLGELPGALRLPAPPCPPTPLLGVSRVM